MLKRNKKKDTKLFFDSFKHFKNNFCNLVCLELPELINLNDIRKYSSLKPVNYKSKLPDMKKIWLINYNKPSDEIFSVSEEWKIIYDIINKKKEYFDYNIYEWKLDSVNPYELRKVLDENESLVVQKELIKLLISYYDTADCIRPYLSLIKILEHFNITILNPKKLCVILSQKKSDILKKEINMNWYDILDHDTQEEIKRPISYIINWLETAWIIDNEWYVIYDKDFVKSIVMSLNDIEVLAEEDTEKKQVWRSADEQRKFRENVLAAYNYKCAITWESICINNYNNTTTYLLEAAHIIPYSDDWSFSTNNWIALSTEMHKLFDRKLFVFNYRDDWKLEIIVTKNENVKDWTWLLKTLNHKIVNLPDDKTLFPDYDAIEYRKSKYLL